MKKILINPDVHGRSFWKEKDLKDYDEIIFLGDYLDPYPNEKIDKRKAIINFEEILNLKKENPDKITLLLGNHDTHYLFGEDDCRLDSLNYLEIRDLFRDNYKLFQIGVIKEGKYSFSHAPVLKGWRNDITTTNILGKTIENTLEELFKKLDNYWYRFIEKHDYSIQNLLSCASWVRGGWSDFGSPIWADLRELTPDSNDWPGYFQIFGHTQLSKDEPAVFKHFACLDCRKSSELSNIVTEE